MKRKPKPNLLRQNSALALLANIVLLASLLLSACQPVQIVPGGVTPTPAPGEDGLLVVDNNEPLPPQVVAQEPAGRQELSLSGDIRLTFDQPMDAEKTGRAWRMTAPDGSPIRGEVSWPNPHTMVVSPLDLMAGMLVEARLSEEAASAEGVPLQDPLEFAFQTVTDLQVGQVFPADGASEITNDAVITAIFNRPVVPLVTAGQQAGLVNPLEIDPPIQGSGEWISTSVYAFRPEEPLLSSTTYTVRVPAGLADAAGETQLGEDFTWQFTTSAAALGYFALTSNGWVNPENNTRNVLLDEGWKITFQQPMEPAVTEAAISIRPDSGAAVSLDSLWNEDRTQVIITPTQLLDTDTQYTLAVDPSARAADGGTLREGLTWSFTTHPAPAVEFVSPPTNTGPDFYNQLMIKFTAPMRLDTVKERIVITPAPAEPFEWWYDEYYWAISAYILEPSTDYTVTILPGMEDIYGHVMEEGTTISFTTNDYPPSAYLQMPYMPAVVRQDGPQDFYANYRNVDSITLELYRLTPTQFVNLSSGQLNMYTYRPEEADRVWELSETNTAGLNQRVLKKYTPTIDGEPLPPGFYFLALDAPVPYKDGPFADRRFLIVGTANLTIKTTTNEALAWVTDLTSGEPVAGAPVQVYDKFWNLLGEGETDADGKVLIPVPTPADPNEGRYAISAGEGAWAFASDEWGSGANLYDYGIWSRYYAPGNLPTFYLYTDRPLYRPGQQVYFKGIVRMDDDLAYSLPPESQVHIRIENFEETVYEADLPLSSFGSFSGELRLDTEAALGFYTIYANLPGSEATGSVSFNVAEYRKPEFQVSVSAEPEAVLVGDDYAVTIRADYYSGGAVENSNVAWTLMSSPYFFTPPDEFSRYSFRDVDEDTRFFTEQPGFGDEIIASGEGVTGPDGTLEMTLPAELAAGAGSSQFTFEASITDIAQNTVTNRDTVIAHRSRVYVGVRPESYVSQANQEATFLLAALDWDGQPLPGQSVDVEIVERRWYSVQEQDPSGRIRWTSTVEDVPVASFPGITVDSQGKASVDFTPPKGGTYRARVTAQDEAGNQASASAYLWVAGDDFIPWRQSEDRSFDLVADRDLYAPGDTAQILIASPFEGESHALVTVERGRIKHHEVILLTSNSTVYELPITPDLAPNAYVSVVVVKGVDGTQPRPTFRMGITEIRVEPKEQALAVQVWADREQASPGEVVNYTVRVSDAEGRPVQAEVSLGLSDLATLSLAAPNSIPMLDYFYSHRTLSVWTSVPLMLSLEDYNVDVEASANEGGLGGAGGGKGEGDWGVIGVRQDFPDTALWEAHLVTGENGEGTVSVALPDNLTTWRMDARAVTPDTRVGQTTVDLRSTKPLLVRPQTPRFFIAGDRARLGTAVQNNTGEDLHVRVSLEAQGVTLQNEAVQEVDLPAGQQSFLTWEAVVETGAQRVALVFSAESTDPAGFADASRPPAATLDGGGLPVYRYEAPETVGTSGQMTAEGSLPESIFLPSEMNIQEGDLQIKISPSLAAGVSDGLEYLQHSRYESVEETISRFLPNIVTTRALKSASLSDPALEENLATQVSTALQRLSNWQNADGGWGWWTSRSGATKSDPQTTAYAVLALVEAKQAGYEINEAMLTRGAGYLNRQVKSIQALAEPHTLNRQAFILYVLARAEKPNPSALGALYEQRHLMAVYARAFLARALHLVDPEDPRLETLLSDFATEAITSATGTHWEEEEDDPWNWNTDTRTTAIVLATLSQLDTQNPLNANAVRWLMSHRTEGRWEGSQETAWTLMALTDWMVASGELEANYQYAIALNGNRLGGGEATPETLRQSYELTVDANQLLRDEVNRLVFARSDGPGNLYYTAHLDVSLPVEQIAPLDQGITISRSYYRPDDLETPVTTAKVGELLLSRLTIVAPAALHYTVVDDPLPAGFEAVDQTLLTSVQNLEVPQQFTLEDMWLRGWGWWSFEDIQIHDEKVVLSASYLPAGTYVYTYLVRASIPGEFQVIPPTAQEVYFPEVYGRGAGSLFTITP